MVTEELAEHSGPIAADRTTVDKILYNALEHFSKHGYSGASVREITQASQVTKPTLYYYFKNKEELYRRLAETCFNEAIGVLKKAAMTPGTAYNRSLNMIKAYSQFVKERYIVARFLHLMDTSPQRDAPETGFSDFTRQAFEQFCLVVKQDPKQASAGEAVGIAYAVMSVFHLYIGTMLSRTSLSQDIDNVELSLKAIFR